MKNDNNKKDEIDLSFMESGDCSLTCGCYAEKEDKEEKGEKKSDN